MRIIIINLKLPLLQQGQMRNRKVACLFSYKKLGSQSVGSGSSVPIPDIQKVMNIMLKLILF